LTGSVFELLLADARTPSGGYAHSGGLEALVESDSSVAVDEFMRARLGTVGRVEAAFAAAACRCASVDSLRELDLEWAARTPAEPVRHASRQLGRGLLRTALTWFRCSALLEGYRDASVLTPRPIVLGLVASAGGVDPRGAARLSLYDDAATVAAAAVKLLPLDSAVASGWVLSVESEISSLAALCSGLEELPSCSTPLLDRRAMAHSSNERRLFVS
jgi:urease accessory protein